MNYDNLKKAKQIISEIDKFKQLIEELSIDKITVNISSHYSIMSIGTGETSEHELRNLAFLFKENIIKHYKNKIEKAHKELELL